MLKGQGVLCLTYASRTSTWIETLHQRSFVTQEGKKVCSQPYNTKPVSTDRKAIRTSLKDLRNTYKNWKFWSILRANKTIPFLKSHIVNLNPMSYQSSYRGIEKRIPAVFKAELVRPIQNTKDHSKGFLPSCSCFRWKNKLWEPPQFSEKLFCVIREWKGFLIKT